MLMSHDDYAKDRALRDPEFAAALRQRAIHLLDGNEEDRRIAFRILQKQLELSDEEVKDLDQNKATA